MLVSSLPWAGRVQLALAASLVPCNHDISIPKALETCVCLVLMRLGNVEDTAFWSNWSYSFAASCVPCFGISVVWKCWKHNPKKPLKPVCLVLVWLWTVDNTAFWRNWSYPSQHHVSLAKPLKPVCLVSVWLGTTENSTGFRGFLWAGWWCWEKVTLLFNYSLLFLLVCHVSPRSLTPGLLLWVQVASRVPCKQDISIRKPHWKQCVWL